MNKNISYTLSNWNRIIWINYFIWWTCIINGFDCIIFTSYWNAKQFLQYYDTMKVFCTINNKCWWRSELNLNLNASFPQTHIVVYHFRTKCIRGVYNITKKYIINYETFFKRALNGKLSHWLWNKLFTVN